MDYRTLEEKYKSLPPEVRAAMDSVEVAKKIMAIGEKYALHIDKVDELSNETSMVMLGVTPSEKYKERLINVLEITDDVAQKIIGDINNEVLYPIRGSLRKIYEVTSSTENGAREGTLSREGGSRGTEEPQRLAEEKLDRKELLRVIESPETIGSIKNKVLSIKGKDELVVDRKLGISEEKIQETPGPALGIAEQKMEGAFKMESSQTVEIDKSIAAIKKVDPYREAIL